MNKKIKLLVATVLILMTSCEKEKLDYEIFGTWRWEKTESIYNNPPYTSILDILTPDENLVVKLVLSKKRIKWYVNDNLTYNKLISHFSHDIRDNKKTYRVNIYDKSVDKTEYIYVHVESHNTITLSGGPFSGGANIHFGGITPLIYYKSYFQRIK